MAILGAHMSIAGGYCKSVVSAHEAGCDCVQLFTKNNNQWRAKPISENEANEFQAALADHPVRFPLSHSSYLINLASPDRELRKKSIDGMIVELQRAEQLGIPYVVLHPGSYTTSSESQGLKQIARSLNEIHKQTSDLKAAILLENTAGQGSNLGWKFEQLARILETVKEPDKLGICLDTCHAHAAGYGLQNEADYKQTMRELNQLVGISLIKAVHLNDSKRELGSRVDRHEHIGQGELGLEPFRRILHDRRFRKVPMYLETPKGKNDKDEDWDVVNLRTLRGLIE